MEGSSPEREYGAVSMQGAVGGEGQKESHVGLNFALFLKVLSIMMILWLFSYSPLRQGIFSPDIFLMILLLFSLLFGSFPFKASFMS